MDAVYELLTDRAMSLTRPSQHAQLPSSLPRSRQKIIALAGPPGSGKSTIASEVTKRLNSRTGRHASTVVPMDGFHYSRAHLDKLPNREEAYARRGAHWTFDADGVVDLVKRLCDPQRDRSEVILAPAFDHAEKDPVEEAIRIDQDVDVLILEGNWLLYDAAPWRQIHGMVDESWFVDVEADLALDRIVRRHLESGIEATWDAAVARARQNDLLNGEEVRRCLMKPDTTVKSIQETDVDSGEEDGGGPGINLVGELGNDLTATAAA